MGTIILASANKDVKEFSKHFPKSPDQTRVLRITSACRDVPDTTYIERGASVWTSLGMDLEDYDIKGKDQDEVRHALKDKDVVHLTGGNGFHMLLAIRESGFEQVVREFLDQGGVYTGSSSGAYVAGPSIDQHAILKPKWNTVGLTDFTAMKLVPFLVKCHVTEEKLPNFRNIYANLKYPIRLLADGQFFVVKDNQVTFHGSGKEFIL
ncbi:peptidase E [Patescibacteria group bacterium]|nr:peptidase E [Patescibacteria group bacterium]MBU1890431.1 peptidase E [Patescibacteria group bacterium]